MKKITKACISLLYGVLATANAAPAVNQEKLPSLSINDVKEDEQKGKMVFIVTKKGITQQPVSVDFYTHEITAISGKNYIDVTGTLTFAPQQTEQYITVSIINDNVYEGPQLFTVDLTNPVNAIITDNQGLGTITDESDVVHR